MNKITISIFLLILLSGCNFLNQKENEDILSVKKSSTDLGAMYTEKTIEQVVQDIAGVSGTAKWSSSTPTGDFSKEVKLVEVIISKSDTVIYSTIRIQFIFNRSTGYVKQGVILVNSRAISLMEWWSYYTNILLYNSGMYKSASDKNQNNESSGIKDSEKESSQGNNEINLTTFTISSVPDTLSGCSCWLCESKNQDIPRKYFFYSDMGPNCIISVNSKILLLKSLNQDDEYENETYKVIIRNKKVISSEGEGSEMTAEIVVTNKSSGKETIKHLYGGCGC